MEYQHIAAIHMHSSIPLEFPRERLVIGRVCTDIPYFLEDDFSTAMRCFLEGAF
jgi:hypothetical protein